MKKNILKMLSLILTGCCIVFLFACTNVGADDDTVNNSTVNYLPEASFTMSETVVMTEDGTEVLFNATASSDSDGTISAWTWDFGDGNSGTGETVSHTFNIVGGFYVELTVTDDAGGTDTAGKGITANSDGNMAPVADAGPDQAIDVDEDGLTVSLDGSGSSDDVSIKTHNWSFYSKPENSSLTDSDISGADTDLASFDLSGETGTSDDVNGYVYVLQLRVTDSNDAPAVDFVEITVTGDGSINVGIM